MSSSHIEITSTVSPLSAKVRSFVDELNDVISKGIFIKRIMGRYIDGADYTALATALDITAAQATDIYAKWGFMNNELAGTSITNISSDLG